MPRELLHICGPIAINTYGAIIALSVLVFLWLVTKHPIKKKFFENVDLTEVLAVGTFIGICGARIFYVLYEFDTISSFFDVFAIWNGGLWVLGGIISLILFLPPYLYYKHIALLPFADLICIHAGLLQGMARLGCFFAGCCYGIPSNLPWAVTYTQYDTFAPLNIAVHPTQLYSAILLFLIFCFMYFIAQHIFKKAGQLTCLYLILLSCERFIVDMWRDDREMFSSNSLHMLSANQWISVGIGIVALIVFYYFTTRKVERTYT